MYRSQRSRSAIQREGPCLLLLSHSLCHILPSADSTPGSLSQRKQDFGITAPERASAPLQIHKRNGTLLGCPWQPNCISTLHTGAKLTEFWWKDGGNLRHHEISCHSDGLITSQINNASVVKLNINHIFCINYRGWLDRGSGRGKGWAATGLRSFPSRQESLGNTRRKMGWGGEKKVSEKGRHMRSTPLCSFHVSPWTCYLRAPQVSTSSEFKEGSHKAHLVSTLESKSWGCLKNKGIHLVLTWKLWQRTAPLKKPNMMQPLLSLPKVLGCAWSFNPWELNKRRANFLIKQPCEGTTSSTQDGCT